MNLKVWFLVLLFITSLFSQEVDLNNPLVKEYMQKNGINASSLQNKTIKNKITNLSVKQAKEDELDAKENKNMLEEEGELGNLSLEEKELYKFLKYKDFVKLKNYEQFDKQQQFEEFKTQDKFSTFDDYKRYENFKKYEQLEKEKYSNSPFSYELPETIYESLKEKKVNSFDEKGIISSENEIRSKNQFVFNNKSKENKLKRYGLNFFENKSSEPVAFITPPDNYILALGDEIKISIYGSQNIEYTLSIEKDGSLTIPKVGKVNINNFQYKKAKEFLTKKLNNLYPNSEAYITIAELRTVSVSVTGEVKNPGQYNLPGLSKVKDALIYASGISELGSLRNVKLIRNNKTVSTFDLYQLLKKGKSTGDMILRSGDTVFVPLAKKLVSIEEGVRKPAIYELKDNEGLKTLIKYSGGLLSDSIKSVKLQRAKNGKKNFLDIDVSKNISLNDGDKITIPASANFYKNRVSLLGNVYRDEHFQISENETLSQLFNRIIKNHGGLENIFMPQTDLNYVVVKRIDTNTLEEKIYSKNLLEVLKGNKKEDITLKSEDKIYVFNKNLVEDTKYVTVQGEVQKEGKFKYFKGMTLLDVLKSAVLKKESDKNRIRVISYDKNMKQTVKFSSLEFAHTLKLKQYDEISISNFFVTNDFEMISIKGAVNAPGEFQYSKNITLRDLIAYAKGLKNSVRYDSFELISYETINNKRVPKIKKLNLKEALIQDIVLKPYDEVIIQEINGWNEKNIVTLEGEVMFPGEYTITPGEKLSDIIKRAGGFTDEAFVRGSVFTREDVKKIQRQALEKQVKTLEDNILYYSTKGSEAGQSQNNDILLKYMEQLKEQAKDIEVVGRVAVNIPKDIEELKNSEFDMVLKHGDTLTVPTYEDSVMVIGEVMTQNALTWYDGDDVLDYINRVGGMKDSANKEGIFVVKANGEAVKVGYSSLFGLSSTEVEKGDVIVVPFNVSQFSQMQYAKDVTSIIYQIAVSAASLKTLGAL